MFNVIIESWDYDISTIDYVVYCLQDCSIPGINVNVVKYI